MRCKLLFIGVIVAVSAVIAQSVPSRSEPKKETAGLSAREEDKAQAKSDRSALIGEPVISRLATAGMRATPHSLDP